MYRPLLKRSLAGRFRQKNDYYTSDLDALGAFSRSLFLDRFLKGSSINPRKRRFYPPEVPNICLNPCFSPCKNAFHRQKHFPPISGTVCPNYPPMSIYLCLAPLFRAYRLLPYTVPMLTLIRGLIPWGENHLAIAFLVKVAFSETT